MRITLAPALFILVLICPGLAFAQDFSKVEEAFSSEELARLKESDTDKMEYLQFKANECYSVQDLSGMKDISELNDVSTLNQIVVHKEAKPIMAANFDNNAFNPLLYNIESQNRPAYYRIGDTGRLLKIYSEKRCKELYQQ